MIDITVAALLGIVVGGIFGVILGADVERRSWTKFHNLLREGKYDEAARAIPGKAR